MNYELIKKIKKLEDAGFSIQEDGFLIEGKQIYFSPTLEELIGACGDKFNMLTKDYNTGIWHAWARGTQFIQGKGKTPFKAVANLWLTLQKK